MTVIPEKGKWTRLVQVVGESAGKAAARFGRNFSGVEDDLRGHTGKMTRPAISLRSCDSGRADPESFAISIFRHYPEFRRQIPLASRIKVERSRSSLVACLTFRERNSIRFASLPDHRDVFYLRHPHKFLPSPKFTLLTKNKTFVFFFIFIPSVYVYGVESIVFQTFRDSRLGSRQCVASARKADTKLE